MHELVYATVKAAHDPWHIESVRPLVAEVLEPHRERDDDPDDDDAGLVGHWDWFAIGGRWTGVLDLKYDPALDPRNYMQCAHCHRSFFSDFPIDGKLPCQELCVRCYGSGLELRWPTAWVPFDGDVVRASVARDRILRDPEKAPRSLVHNGTWASRSLWNRATEVLDDTPGSEWRTLVCEALELDDDWHVVVVDCHC